jgi:ABC-type phosphate transport system substrate-binding protein
MVSSSRSRFTRRNARSRGPVRLCLLVLAGALLLTSSAWATAAEPFVVVVNPSVQGVTVHRADLAAVFLKKASRWGDGSSAIPIDQSGTSPVREAFSGTVLQMPVTAVVQYWQRQLLAATSAARLPTVKPSDEEVFEYVAKTKGAVAYVSADASLPPGVKTLTVVD